MRELAGYRMERAQEMRERQRLRYGMVGGGRRGFIGGVHRKAIALEENADLVAGCFSSRGNINREAGVFYEIDETRIYNTYQEMAQAESRREDCEY